MDGRLRQLHEEASQSGEQLRRPVRDEGLTHAGPAGWQAGVLCDPGHMPAANCGLPALLNDRGTNGRRSRVKVAADRWAPTSAAAPSSASSKWLRGIDCCWPACPLAGQLPEPTDTKLRASPPYEGRSRSSIRHHWSTASPCTRYPHATEERRPVQLKDTRYH